MDTPLKCHILHRRRTEHTNGYDSGATRCLLPLSSPDTVGCRKTCDWTRPTKWTRAIERDPSPTRYFIIYLKNAYQIRKRFFFIFSLPFPASGLHCCTSSLSSHLLRLLPVSFLVFVAAGVPVLVSRFLAVMLLFFGYSNMAVVLLPCYSHCRVTVSSE